MSSTVVDTDRSATVVTGPRGRPCLLHWHGRTYRVTDAPTPLEEAVGTPSTHPLPVQGWRFQGTCVHDGEALVFDVVTCGAGWHVVRTYA